MDTTFSSSPFLSVLYIFTLQVAPIDMLYSAFRLG